MQVRALQSYLLSECYRGAPPSVLLAMAGRRPPAPPVDLQISHHINTQNKLHYKLEMKLLYMMEIAYILFVNESNFKHFIGPMVTHGRNYSSMWSRLTPT